MNGWKFTSTNGNSIFLPATGYRDFRDEINAGICGYYWTSSLCAGNPLYARLVAFSSNDLDMSYYYYRYYGLYVRAVRDRQN